MQTINQIPIPGTAEVEQIQAIADPVVRNLCITQCYYKLSNAVISRTGLRANWCTFATWASKQAGQTIRREDLRRTIEMELNKDPIIHQVTLTIAALAKKLGSIHAPEHIKQTAIRAMVQDASARASDAVARGNKKVFEEIAWQFARFLQSCYNDKNYSAESIENFAALLRAGEPPDGQQYLHRAFKRYYQCFFENDPKKRDEQCFLANIEIGFHEQTRLQPEIAESLNTLHINRQKVKDYLQEKLLPSTHTWSRFLLLVRKVAVNTNVFGAAIDRLAQLVEQQIRKIVTAQLMTLALPGKILRLGIDLEVPFPETLKTLADNELIAMLKRVDPTADSILQSGAIDWSDLSERLHFITDLFRCYHNYSDLFKPPFSQEQVALINAGKVPSGIL